MKNIKIGIGAAALSLVLVFSAFVAGAPAQNQAEAEETVVNTEVTEEGWGTVPYIDNDTAVRGEYTPYVPVSNDDVYAGEQIEGNEEEELQQERIAGGAVGEATSDVEELHGVTDYSEGEYVPVYGID